MTHCFRTPFPDDLQPTVGAVDVLVAPASGRPTTLTCLSAAERERGARFYDPETAARFAYGRALLRIGLAALVGAEPAALRIDTWCERCASPHGKPRLVEPAAALDFSLSRAGPWLALAVARVRVGVDVEPSDRFVAPSDVDVALAPDERLELSAVATKDVPAALLRWWTQKEALLKALGHGFAIDPALVAVTIGDAPAAVRRIPAEFDAGDAWSLLPFGWDGVVGAVAVEGPASLRLWDARALL